jgi:hypothetical protein
MILIGENWRHQRETCLNAMLFATNPTWTALGVNPGLYNEKPVTAWSRDGHPLIFIMHNSVWSSSVVSVINHSCVLALYWVHSRTLGFGSVFMDSIKVQSWSKKAALAEDIQHKPDGMSKIASISEGDNTVHFWLLNTYTNSTDCTVSIIHFTLYEIWKVCRRVYSLLLHCPLSTKTKKPFFN